MRFLTTAALAVAFAYLLLLVGDMLLHLAAAPSWLVKASDWLRVPSWARFDVDYAHQLGPNVGGSGLDAVIIGSVAGMVASRLDRWRDDGRRRRGLHRRRRRNASPRLKEQLEHETAGLPLWGFTFDGDQVEDLRLRRVLFSQKGGMPSTLRQVAIDGCDLVSVDADGCNLDHVAFRSCTLRRCKFRGASFRSDRAVVTFNKSDLSGCAFDGATFEGVTFEDAVIRGCTFWGASFHEFSEPPEALFRELKEIDGLENLVPNGFRIRTRKELLVAATSARIRFVVRETCSAWILTLLSRQVPPLDPNDRRL